MGVCLLRLCNFKQLLKGSQHFTSLQATTFQNLQALKPNSKGRHSSKTHSRELNIPSD